MKTARGVVLLTLLVSSCSGAADRSLITQFFAASRLRDLTALSKISTVVFEPAADGIVTSFDITRGRGRYRVETGVDLGPGAAARRPDGIEELRDHHPARHDYGDQRICGISFDSAAVITHSPCFLAILTLASRESTVE